MCACVCAPAGQSCSPCVFRGSAVLFSPLHEVSGQPSRERRGKGRGKRIGEGKGRKEEEKGRRQVEREGEQSKRLNSLQ